MQKNLGFCEPAEGMDGFTGGLIIGSRGLLNAGSRSGVKIILKAHIDYPAGGLKREACL